MRYALMNSGVPVEAEFSQENIDGIFLPLLARLGAIRREKGRRAVALLAAPPGAGKSTLAALLERLSGDGPEPLTALGMDGFHFPRDYLQSHEVKIDGQAVPLASVKGAPPTFDLDGLTAVLARVAAGENCPWPAYSRTLHDPVLGARTVTGEIVLIEGNYLLLDAPGWRELRQYADLTVSIAAAPALLRARLLARHLAVGRSREAAEAFVDRSDMANVRLCLERTLPADLRLRLESDGTFTKLP